MTQVAAEKPESNSTERSPTLRPASAVKRLRIWPAIVLLLLIWTAKLIPLIAGDAAADFFPVFMFGPTLCALAIMLWWMFFSRALFGERIAGFLGWVAIGFLTMAVAHVSIRSFFLVLMYVVPIGVTGFALPLVLFGAFRPKVRTSLALLGALIAFGYWDFLRFEGLSGDFQSVMMWRWQRNAEEEFLANLANKEAALDSAGTDVAAASDLSINWPQFRGDQRAGQVPGVTLSRDWQNNSPQERWRIRVGPGWSSFSVAGDLLFTQEQRGDQEAVVCYGAATGQQRWARSYPSRFFEAIAGPGPRATPTLHGDRLFALGAMGILNCLDPHTGQVIWQQDIKKDANREPPIWGFSSSPLVTAGMVIVHAGGKGDRGVLAYDMNDGQLRWGAAAGDHSYSSPHLALVGDKSVVLMLTNSSLTAIDPATGAIAWQTAGQFGDHTVLQPLVWNNSTILVSGGLQNGTTRLDLSFTGQSPAISERWISKDMKSDFNDFVAHKGFLYGFDGSIFACVNIETGDRQWKGGRYGKGQVLLLPDADQLLVLAESGEIVLLQADPSEFLELARHAGLNGKTWNHPVLIGDRLYLRNGEEAACYQMPVVN